MFAGCVDKDLVRVLRRDDVVYIPVMRVNCESITFPHIQNFAGHLKVAVIKIVQVNRLSFQFRDMAQQNKRPHSDPTAVPVEGVMCGGIQIRHQSALQMPRHPEF